MRLLHPHLNHNWNSQQVEEETQQRGFKAFLEREIEKANQVVRVCPDLRLATMWISSFFFISAPLYELELVE